MGVTVSSKEAVKYACRLASLAALLMLPLSSTLQADEVVRLDGDWTVSTRTGNGNNRCILRSSTNEDHFWLGNNGVPRIAPNGAAALGLVLRHTTEDWLQISYPKELNGVVIIAPGKGVWEVDGIWERGKVGGAARIQLNIPIEEFLNSIEAATELIIVLPLNLPENIFSLKGAAEAMALYRKCLAE